MTDKLHSTVLSACEHEVRTTAELHVTQLPHGLFPRLGRGFVRRWHRAYLGAPHGSLLVAHDDDGEVVGFLLGTTDRRADVAWILRRHRRELLLSGAASLAGRPWLIGSFLRTRGASYARRIFRAEPMTRPGTERAVQPGSERLAVLEAIVVDHNARGHGVGTALTWTFLADVAAAGVERVELVTKADARGAGGFYQRIGWQPAGEHIDRDGDVVLTYQIGLPAGEVS